jgi:thiol:disulfide interchange protein
MSKVWPACAIALVLMAVAMWTKLILSDQGGVGYEAGKIRTPYVVRWIPWSPGIVENFRQQGRTVWLNFYAEWDLTFLVNIERIFSDDSVLNALSQHRVVLVREPLNKAFSDPS